MSRTFLLLQLGLGNVGRAVLAQVSANNARWRERYGVDVRYAAIADSSAFVLADGATRGGEDAALSAALSSVMTQKARGEQLAALTDAVPFAEWERVLASALTQVSEPSEVAILDCASGGETTPLLLAARARGAHVVLANKDPLVGPYSSFLALRDGGAGGSLRMSATVGAGLPVLASAQRLVASGDSVQLVEARASGSLGFLCDQLSQGVPFDTAVRAAVEAGYTEPDPRQDLSGFDVARKLLILARVAGVTAEMSDVTVESLVPEGAETLSTKDFLAALPDYAGFLADRVARARTEGKVLRYVATLRPPTTLSAELRDLAPSEPLAYGSGPDNVFALHTQTYMPRPLVIAGPGAGAAVTAGAVVADLLQALGAI